jgi:hypothetical protein
MLPSSSDGQGRTGHVDESVDAKLLLTSLIDSTTDLIWSVDPEGFTIQSTNRALREIGDLAAEAVPRLQGEPFFARFTGYLRERCQVSPEVTLLAPVASTR